MGSPLNDAAQILRASPAPPPPGLYLHPASPTYRDDVMGLVVSEYPVCYETHWIDAKVGPHKLCTAATGECPWCHLERRWTAAVVLRLSKGGGLRLVRITEHAARNCTSGHFRDPPKPIRGWGLRYSREVGGRTGRLRVELSYVEGLGASLPVGPDLSAVVMHLYGADRAPRPGGGVQ